MCDWNDKNQSFIVKKRNGKLDVLKFIFALIIVIHHSTHMRDSKNWFYLGQLGVEFFFIISGSMMMMSYDRSEKHKEISLDTVAFIKSKILRLLPNIYVAWVIAFIVNSIVEKGDICRNLIYSIPDFLFLQQTGLPCYLANTPTWYLSSMMISLFILYPMICKNRNFFVFFLAPVLMFLGLQYLGMRYGYISVIYDYSPWGFEVGIIRGMSDILIGVLAYQISLRIKSSSYTNIMKIIFSMTEVLLYIIILVFFIKSYYIREEKSLEFIILFVIACAVTITISNVGYFDKYFNNSFSNWLGEYSYSLFLSHFFYTKLSYMSPFTDWTFNQNFLLYIVLSFMTGLFVMYFSKCIVRFWEIVKPRIMKKIIL